MGTPRVFHTATLLHDGLVLVAGGYDETSFLDSAELYNPVTGTWSPTGSMGAPRAYHSATRMDDGKIFVAGGLAGYANFTSTTEIYDVSTHSWSYRANMSVATCYHAATLLPFGNLLITGGQDNTYSPVNRSEIYNYVLDTFTPTNSSLLEARSHHTTSLLPSGYVLAVGGYNSSYNGMNTVEVFDQETGNWLQAGNLNPGRGEHTATLLPSGRLLVAGGSSGASSRKDAYLYDYNYPASWTATGSMNYFDDGYQRTATLLPNGKVLYVGKDTAELYDPDFSGTWLPPSNNSALTGGRCNHTATLLPDERVLITGGRNAAVTFNTAGIFDPNNVGMLSNLMQAARSFHTATLLCNGKVLLAGGKNSVFLSSAELFDPASNIFTSTGGMASVHANHTATLLADGKVLVVGGATSSTPAYTGVTSLYDPVSGTWAAKASLPLARGNHTATLLPNGNVLVAGGINGADTSAAAYSAACYIYNPTTNVWSAASSMGATRAYHTAKLLLNGKVLVTGGRAGQYIYRNTAEVYDPVTNSWTLTGSLATSRAYHADTLLNNGKVMVSGGFYATGSTVSTMHFLNGVELYDPATNQWTATTSLNSSRRMHTSTILSDGTVVVAGGLNVNLYHTSLELFNYGLGYDPSWQPEIPAYMYNTLLVSGVSSVGFYGRLLQGLSEANGGNAAASAANNPVMTLRSLQYDTISHLSLTGWYETSLLSEIVNFPVGHANGIVISNGIPSLPNPFIIQ